MEQDYRSKDNWKYVVSKVVTEKFETQFLDVNILVKPGEEKVFTLHSESGNCIFFNRETIICFRIEYLHCSVYIE